MFGRVALPLLSLALLWAIPVRAQEEGGCPTLARRAYETVPISGSTGVSTNAIVRARYPEGHLARHEERITLFGEQGEPVPGRLEASGEDVLFFVPEVPLEALGGYTAHVSGVDGDLTVSFRTGTARDEEPPTRPRIVSAEAGKATLTCAHPEGGIRLSFVVEASDDDGPLGSLQYSLYRTRGPLLEAPTRLARVSQAVFPGEEQPIGAVIGEAEAGGVSCFVVMVEDGLFRTVTSEAHCFEPGVGVIFDSLCAVSAPSRAAPLFWPVVLSLALVILRARRSEEA